MTFFLSEEFIHKKTPQEITALLYEACILNLEKSIIAIQDKNYFQANECLKRSNDILYRLGGGINYEAGIIADQLEALYDYAANKLIEANLKKDVRLIEEVLHMIKEIEAAWNTALQSKTESSSNYIKNKSDLYEKNMRYDNQS